MFGSFEPFIHYFISLASIGTDPTTKLTNEKIVKLGSPISTNLVIVNSAKSTIICELGCRLVMC